MSVPPSAQAAQPGNPNVRRRDDGDNISELDVDLAPKKKRRYRPFRAHWLLSVTMIDSRTNPESLSTKGAHYTVMVDMWRDIETVIETGLRVRGAQGVARDRFSEQ